MIKLKDILFEAESNFRKITLDTFRKYESQINTRFNDGYATCTFAVFKLGEALKNANIPFTVISGDYDDNGHWWIELESGTILDIGNNIKEESMESGEIEPVITNNKTGYVSESEMTYREFLRMYPSIKDY